MSSGKRFFLLVQVEGGPWGQRANRYKINVVVVGPVVQGPDVKEDLGESVADGLSPPVGGSIAPQRLNILGDVACSLQ